MGIDKSYNLASGEVADLLDVNLVSGLNNSEAEQRFLKNGPNTIKGKGSKSLFLIFAEQFKSALVILLLVAAGLSFFFKEWLDGIAIIVVILINAIIGFFMEFEAEKSMEALKKLASTKARVIRNSIIQELESEKIVPGDILFVEAGDIILADGRIFHVAQFQVDESTLTGESVPVEKQIESLKGEVPLPERTNMVFKGTFVTKGNARILVVETGMQSELGKIAGMVQSADQAATPLEKRLEQFSKKLIWLTVILVVLVFIGGLLNGQKIVEMLETSIALAVAAVPEGLPIVATLALAQGMLKMAKRNVIVKKLAAVETLGGTTVICTDKTGTLTQNIMTVSSLFTESGIWNVREKKNSELQNDVLNDVYKVCVLCNTASIIHHENKIEETGDPLETALLRFALENETDSEELRNRFLKISEEPFSSETKVMATLHKDGDAYFIAAKGAVEMLIKKCTHIRNENEIELLDSKKREEWLLNSEKYAGSGLRLLGFAYRKVNTIPEHLCEELVFVGIIGLLDPPREEVADAIAECHSAGIKVVMITGDHPATAKNIADKLGIISNEGEELMNGSEMGEYETLNPAMRERWLHARVFARVNPKQKLDLVKLFQDKGEVVGMTGDGVNDAPALKKADIGIAMGKRGNQVAQEVADMILKDDSFSSIVLAVRQGRVIFENIRKFVIYLLSCNLSELFAIAIAAVLNMHFQLFPLQILFINLVTDVLPALALGVTDGNSGLMTLKPRNPSEPIIDRKRWRAIIVYALVITACVLGAVFFSHETVHHLESWNHELCNNIMFLTLIFCQLLHVFNMNRDIKVSFFKSEIVRNKYAWYAIVICTAITLLFCFIDPLAKVLSLDRLSIQDWAIIIGFSFLSFLTIRTLKRFKIIL